MKYFFFVRHLLHSLGFGIEVHSVSIIKDNALLAFAEKENGVTKIHKTKQHCVIVHQSEEPQNHFFRVPQRPNVNEL